MPASPEILTFRFQDAGGIPNNPVLPALVYKRVTPAALDPGALAEWFETLAKAERSHANRFTKGLESLKQP